MEELQLIFPDGDFKGKETKLRITPDKQWVSAIDLIRVIGDQKNPHSTWERIYNEHENEVLAFCENLKFKGRGQRETSVINAKGVVLLLMWIPGEKAAKFRSEAADVLVRYLGGDVTLINEIKAIDETHEQNPDNVLAPFREILGTIIKLNAFYYINIFIPYIFI